MEAPIIKPPNNQAHRRRERRRRNETETLPRRSVQRNARTLMKDTIQVTKIEIRIGAKTLSLSIEEMKELKEILNDTFPNPVQILPPAPVVIERPIYPRWPWSKWDVTWGTETMCLAATR